MERKYEIFISSTKIDLEPEREFVQEQIIRSGHIPVGMELFSGEMRGIWKVIQTAIERSDFYILILAGRYGLAKGKSKSFTEKEFDYAVKLKKPIIAFVLDDEGLKNLAVKFVDENLQNKNKLEKFRNKVTSQHVQKYNDTSKFKGIFQVNLQKFIQENDNPDLGWIRAGIVNTEIGRIKKLTAESSIYRFMFNSLSSVKNVPCDFHESNIKLDPSAEDISAVLHNLANLLLRYVDKETNQNVDVYFACQLDAENSGNKKYAIVIGRKSKDSNGKDRLLDETSNCHYVFDNNTPRYWPDVQKVKNGSNQFLSGEQSILSLPISINRKCIGVIGFSSKKINGLKTDYSFATDEVKPLCDAVFEAYSRRSGLFGDPDEAVKLREKISSYIKIDDENYQNIILS